MKGDIPYLLKCSLAVLGVVLVALALPLTGMALNNSSNTCSACEVVPGILHLYSKDPHTWEIAPNKAQARLDYSTAKGTFRLNADMLEPDTSYALIQHETDYPAGRGYIIAIARSNNAGVLQLDGTWKRWSGKIWLVPRSDVRGRAGDQNLDRLLRWDPERYLFEARVL